MSLFRKKESEFHDCQICGKSVMLRKMIYICAFEHICRDCFQGGLIWAIKKAYKEKK